jgi:phosphoribosyl 1,2-cyclic phosphodiesterase
MPLRFTVLASGSGGNASLLQTDDHCLLLDIGLGPRLLSWRLAAVGCAWPHVDGVLLTHTHSDHWKELTLGYLHRFRIPLYCHAGHREWLHPSSSAFAALAQADLVREYRAEEDFEPAPGLRCRPLALRHDGGPTFGFRVEGRADGGDDLCALGYVADLGSWTPELAEALADVDLLALEFNHDVEMEYASGRSTRLIARVLGDHGHLSNLQAATLLKQVLCISAPGRLRQLVQLHLSRDCNHPRLALEAARAVLGDDAPAFAIHTASQDAPGPVLHVGGPAGERSSSRPARLRKPVRSQAAPSCQPWLPGLEL